MQEISVKSLPELGRSYEGLLPVMSSMKTALLTPDFGSSDFQNYIYSVLRPLFL